MCTTSLKKVVQLIQSDNKTGIVSTELTPVHLVLSLYNQQKYNNLKSVFLNCLADLFNVHNNFKSLFLLPG